MFDYVDVKNTLSNITNQDLYLIMYFCYNFKNYVIRFSIPFKLITSVEVLCNNADVVGLIKPLIPKTINPVLNPTITW